MAASPGAVCLRSVSRRFRVIHEKNTTLKEVLIRRRRAQYSDLWALRDVSFSIAPGESVALIGRNGSGKSTTLKLLAGILPPHSGSVEVGGSIAAMLELGSGFHPDFTGRENVFMNGAIHGLSERIVRERFDAIVDFAELQDFIDMPVRTYSSGMQMRLAYAVAAHVEPDVLLLDEVLSVGDAAFQQKCVDHIHGFRERGGTLVFVSHAADAVREVCDRAILISDGRIHVDGPVETALEQYQALVEAGETRVGGEFEATAAVKTSAEHTDAAEGSGANVSVDLAAVEVPANRVSPSDLLGTEPLTLHLNLTATDDLGFVNLGIAITDDRGVDVLSVRSADFGFTPPLSVGESRVGVRVPIPVSAGDLNVTLSAWDAATGRLLSSTHHSAAIQVTGGWPTKGVLSVPVEWQLVP